MSVLGWILLGLIAGFIGSKIVNREGQGPDRAIGVFLMRRTITMK
jgi:uncharacterized membrane protein YeaQ/YmgE (transglycosylase-associated protein family)